MWDDWRGRAFLRVGSRGSFGRVEQLLGFGQQPVGRFFLVSIYYIRHREGRALTAHRARMRGSYAAVGLAGATAPKVEEISISTRCRSKMQHSRATISAKLL